MYMTSTDASGILINMTRTGLNILILSLNSAKSGQIEHAPAPSSHSIKMAISCLKQYPESLFLAIVSYFTKTRGSSQ